LCQRATPAGTRSSQEEILHFADAERRAQRHQLLHALPRAEFRQHLERHDRALAVRDQRQRFVRVRRRQRRTQPRLHLLAHALAEEVRRRVLDERRQERARNRLAQEGRQRQHLGPWPGRRHAIGPQHRTRKVLRIGVLRRYARFAQQGVDVEVSGFRLPLADALRRLRRCGGVQDVGPVGHRRPLAHLAPEQRQIPFTLQRLRRPVIADAVDVENLRHVRPPR
jgi:hypothetical protein